jgi:lactobin A/cerein 7B family class IIb bacteriocin
MKELSAVEIEEVSGGFVWAVAATFVTAYAVGYAKGKYDTWRDSLESQDIDGWSSAT